MGQSCNCCSINNSEEYIKLVFSCLDSLDCDTFDNVIKRETNVNDQILKSGIFKISQKEFVNTMESVIQQKSSNVNNKYKKHLKSFFSEKFFEKFLSGNEQINKTNGYVFKMLMCPFVLKEKYSDKIKAEYFFDIIKFIKISETITTKNTGNLNYNLSHQNENHVNKHPIPYKTFCEVIQLYLFSVLSGYSKLMLSIMKTFKENIGLINDLKDNLSERFTKNLIMKYYNKIMEKYINATQNAENNDNVNQLEITKEEFIKIVEQNKQLLNYFQLREEFLGFTVDEANENRINYNQTNINEKRSERESVYTQKE